MTKNVGGGKRYKKRKSKVPAGPGRIIYPDDEQLYGIVLKRLGNGWVHMVVCDSTGSNIRKVLGRIRGVLRKRRVPFNEGSYVIACDREFETSTTEKPKVDVVHKYYEEHVRILNKEGRIPMEMKRELDGMTKVANPGSTTSDDELDILFDDGEENEREFDDADIDDL
jgi:initiation factor 1A